MAERLATWVWVGAAALACVAGIVNVIGYLGFQHQAITHLTGNTSLLGAALVAGDGHTSMQLFGAIGAFVAGAALNGLIIQADALQLGRRYGLVLTIESLLLIVAVPMFQRQNLAGPLIAAVACGLQNAMATTYSGAVVRTSHISGMFTDLGIMIGHAIRGAPLARRRMALSALVISFFFLGGLAGSLLFSASAYQSLYLPAAITGTVGIAYLVYTQRWRAVRFPGK